MQNAKSFVTGKVRTKKFRIFSREKGKVWEKWTEGILATPRIGRFFFHLRTRGVILGFHPASRGSRPMRIKGDFSYQKGSNDENIWGRESIHKVMFIEKKTIGMGKLTQFSWSREKIYKI
jgi:hypothetical protein